MELLLQNAWLIVAVYSNKDVHWLGSGCAPDYAIYKKLISTKEKESYCNKRFLSGYMEIVTLILSWMRFAYALLLLSGGLQF